MDANNNKFEMEDQFVLRLPQAEAESVRGLLQSKPKKIKKRLKIDLEPESGAATVYVNGKCVQGRLKKLPTISESYKTHNKTILIKTADVCQLLDCVDPEGVAESPHGLTPPMKNVKRKRFRKCLINKDEVAVNVQKELFYLLQADLEAVSSKFEIIEGESPSNNETNKTEIELFGNVLTDSEETDSNIEDVE